MAKRMSDDDVMNYVYTKVFGDLDGIEADNLFNEKDPGWEDGTADQAEPEDDNSGGVSITVKPITKSSEQGAKETDHSIDGEDDDEDQDGRGLKGISKLSPLMAQLHGDR